MKSRATIDSGGRIVIPKHLRDALHLGPGDSLEVTASDTDIRLRPVRPSPTLVKEHGIWVYNAEPVSTDVDICSLIDQIRDERIEELSG